METTNQIQEVLKDYGFDIGYGFFVGFTVGYAVKKFFKVLLFVLGVYFLTLVWLQHVGVITVHWDIIGNWIKEGQQNFQQYLISLSKSLPFSASFAVGFAAGFKMG
jgi:uncharacterized membrane protein (Fun14 family)